MQTEYLIPVETFCIYYDVEFSLIYSLQEGGLIEITTKEDAAYLSESNVKDAELLVRLHNDLQLNLEGIEVVTHLLDQLKKKDAQITLLQNKLRLYED